MTQQLSEYFEFYSLQYFPKVDWMILYQHPKKYATRIEQAQTQKLQQCDCCGNVVQGKAWALKTGGKHYYQSYCYLCDRCFSNAQKIIEIWKESGQPSYNSFSKDLTDKFNKFRTRLSENGLVEFATTDGLKHFVSSTKKEA